MSNLLARLQQSQQFGTNRSMTGSIRSLQPSQLPQPQRKSTTTTNNNNNSHHHGGLQQQLDHQSKILDKFLSTIDRFQNERNELSASHKAELVERDLLSDQVFLRFMIEVEEQKKKQNSNNKNNSLLVDGTESTRRRKKRNHKKHKYSSSRKNDDGEDSSNSDDGDNNTSSNSENDDDLFSVASSAKSKKRSQSKKMRDDIDMQNNRILLSKISALENKLTAMTKKQQLQDQRHQQQQRRNRNNFNANATQDAENNNEDDEGDDDDDELGAYEKQRHSDSTNAGRTKTVSSPANQKSAKTTKTVNKVSGQRRQRTTATDDEAEFAKNDDDNRSVRSVASAASTTRTANTIKQYQKKQQQQQASTLKSAATPFVNVVGPSAKKQETSEIDAALAKSSENPFLHYLRHLATAATSSTSTLKSSLLSTSHQHQQQKDEALARFKKILNGKAASVGVPPVDAVRKALFQLLGGEPAALPDLNPSSLVLALSHRITDAKNEHEQQERKRIQFYTYTTYSQIVEVTEKSGHLPEIRTACQEICNGMLSCGISSTSSSSSSTTTTGMLDESSRATQMNFLSSVATYLSFSLSSKVINPNVAAKLVRSMIYDSLLSVFLALVKNRGSRDADVLKAKEWIVFVSSLLGAMELGKTLNLFSSSPLDEDGENFDAPQLHGRRDLVALAIELGAQFLFSLASTTPTATSLFSIEVRWDVLRNQLGFPKRYPDVSFMCEMFIQTAMKTCSQVEEKMKSANNSEETNNHQQQLFTVIHALRLLLHVLAMEKGVVECVEILFPSGGNNSDSSNNQNFGDEDDDDDLDYYGKRNDNSSQQQQQQQQPALDPLTPSSLVRACVASFFISDFKYDISTDDDTSNVVLTSPTNQIIRALRGVTSLQRPGTDVLLEFAQLLSICSVLTSSNNNNNNNNSNNSNNSFHRQQYQMLLNECVLHGRDRQSEVQGQPAAKPFITSEIRRAVVQALGEYLQNQS